RWQRLALWEETLQQRDADESEAENEYPPLQQQQQPWRLGDIPPSTRFRVTPCLLRWWWWHCWGPSRTPEAAAVVGVVKAACRGGILR
ncbi:unnamed protein product, partial [Ectocarpus sp. 6 AP-2014]